MKRETTIVCPKCGHREREDYADNLFENNGVNDCDMCGLPIEYTRRLKPEGGGWYYTCKEFKWKK